MGGERGRELKEGRARVTMTQFQSKPYYVAGPLVLGSGERSCLRKSYTTLTLASLARGRGLGHPVDRFRCRNDRMSRVPDLLSRSSHKVGAKPRRSNLVLYNGIADRL